MTPRRTPARMLAVTRKRVVFLDLGLAALTSSTPVRAGRRPAGLSVDLAEHDIEGAKDGGNVGQHVSPVHKVHGLQVRKARRADLAPVGAVAAVRYQIDPKLSLRRLDGGIDLAGGNVEALGVKLEVMD